MTKEYQQQPEQQPQPQETPPAPKISGAVPEEFLCETCGYWVWGKDETQNDGSVLRFGVCIIRAPLAAQSSTQRATWPKTEAKDGCGEHEDAEVPAPREYVPPTPKERERMG